MVTIAIAVTTERAAMLAAFSDGGGRTDGDGGDPMMTAMVIAAMATAAVVEMAMRLRRRLGFVDGDGAKLPRSRRIC